MKTLLILLCSLFFTLVASAQTIVKNEIVVNGLQVGEQYTREAFLKALGTPTKIEPPQETDAYENAYTFYYGKDRFHWIDGRFYGFDLRTSAFLANGFLRVGESIGKIDSLGGIKTYSKDTLLISWCPSEEGLYQWLTLDFYYNPDKTIKIIACFILDL